MLHQDDPEQVDVCMCKRLTTIIHLRNLFRAMIGCLWYAVYRIAHWPGKGQLTCSCTFEVWSVNTSRLVKLHYCLVSRGLRRVSAESYAGFTVVDLVICHHKSQAGGAVTALPFGGPQPPSQKAGGHMWVTAACQTPWLWVNWCVCEGFRGGFWVVQGKEWAGPGIEVGGSQQQPCRLRSYPHFLAQTHL